MLQEDAVEQQTLELIRQLQKDPELEGFCLAGGTALALWLGHRKSEDIDLFGRKPFDAPALLEHLEKTLGFAVQYMAKNTLKGIVNGIFVDIITHDYPLVSDCVRESGMALYSEKDIAAMKVNVITGDGTRIKDFIDIYFLLRKYTMQEIISFYKKKYGLRNEFHALKSLAYFDDLDPAAPWPEMLKEKNLTLQKIKDTIRGEINRYMNARI